MTKDELERAWQDVELPTDQGLVELIVARKGDATHQVLESARLDTDGGLIGDRWSENDTRELERQITLIMASVARLIATDDMPVEKVGDNLHVSLDLGEDNLPAGTRLQIGEVTLEVSAVPHTGCSRFSARFGSDALRWVNGKPNRGQRLRGVNCRVITGGEISLGDDVVVVRN